MKVVVGGRLTSQFAQYRAKDLDRFLELLALTSTRHKAAGKFFWSRTVTRQLAYSLERARGRVGYGTGRGANAIDSAPEAVLKYGLPRIYHNFPKVGVRASSTDRKLALDLQGDTRRRAIRGIGVNDKIVERFAKSGLLNRDAHGSSPPQAARCRLYEKGCKVCRNDRPFEREARATSKFRALDHCLLV
jgi:hypothetical protein